MIIPRRSERGLSVALPSVWSITSERRKVILPDYRAQSHKGGDRFRSECFCCCVTIYRIDSAMRSCPSNSRHCDNGKIRRFFLLLLFLLVVHFIIEFEFGRHTNFIPYKLKDITPRGGRIRKRDEGLEILANFIFWNIVKDETSFPPFWPSTSDFRHTTLTGRTWDIGVFWNKGKQK